MSERAIQDATDVRITRLQHAAIGALTDAHGQAVPPAVVGAIKASILTMRSQVLEDQRAAAKAA